MSGTVHLRIVGLGEEKARKGKRREKSYLTFSEFTLQRYHKQNVKYVKVLVIVALQHFSLQNISALNPQE